jgi:uncharacterized protein (UPF0305 family)
MFVPNRPVGLMVVLLKVVGLMSFQYGLCMLRVTRHHTYGEVVHADDERFAGFFKFDSDDISPVCPVINVAIDESWACRFCETVLY